MFARDIIKKITAACAVVFLTAACGGDKTDNQAENTSIRPTDIKAETAMLQNIDDIYTVPGVVEAWDDITVPSETAGPITWIGPEEGSFINKGDPILKINTDNLLANLNSAKVSLEDDKKEYLRQKNLFAQKAVSQKQYDIAKKTYDLAQVTYKLALDEFNKSTVKSPVTGILDDIIPDIGEYVSPGAEIARIVDMSKLKIYVNIPEKDVRFLKHGQIVDIYPAEIGKEKAIRKGTINYISVAADQATLTHKVRIDIDADEEIRPGRIVRADIVRNTYMDVIVADLYTIIDKDGEKVVFINENGTARERKIIMGEMIGRKAVIISGLQPGDDVVVSNHQFLVDGVPVRVAE